MDYPSAHSCKNTFFLIFAFCFILLTPVYSGDITVQKEKHTLFLLPPNNLTQSKEYAYLKDVIKNVLAINLHKIESLECITPDDYESLSLHLDEMLSIVYTHYSAESCLICEYYVDNDTLHVLINLWDTKALRIKNTYIHTMPADLDMLKNIEWMSKEVTANIGHALPAMEREALIKRQVRSRLMETLDEKEKRLDTILKKRHELQGVMFTGVGLGRTIVSWSPTGFFLSPVINVEYSYFFSNSFHLRFGGEYLPFDIMEIEGYRTEVNAEVLAGFHTCSLSSFTFDVGLAFIYDYNSDCSALSDYNEDGEAVPPAIHRFSVSLPVHIGISLYLHSSFFLNFRFKYHGFTFTIEPLSFSEYPAGYDWWRYTNGFSPWNFLCMSFMVQFGVRF